MVKTSAVNVVRQKNARNKHNHMARCRANIWNAILAVGGACESIHWWPMPGGVAVALADKNGLYQIRMIDSMQRLEFTSFSGTF
jgi:hypothetical protein